MEDEEIDKGIQAKKDYLQKKIIDKNYDRKVSMSFCLSKKKGDELGSWTVEKLKNVVDEFIIIKYPNILPSDKEINSKKTS